MRTGPTIKAFVIIMLLLIMPAVLASGASICGDANDDGGVNISDAVFIVNYVFIGGEAPNPLAVGNVNCDVGVNVSDAVFLIYYIFTGGNAPCDSYPASPNGDDIPDCDLNCPTVVADIDGNVYHSVKIGDQCWMIENLKVTHYRNGDPIPNLTDNGEWYNTSSGAYCDFNNDGGHVEVYGRLYNFYAIQDSGNIAPEGWHIPTDAEWKQMETYLGMSQGDADATGWRGTDEGGKLKEAGTEHWNAPNTGATNETGFTALPGGYRVNNGAFLNMGIYAYFWSATESGDYAAWGRILSSGVAGVYHYSDSKSAGFSLRCVKD